MSLAAVLDMPKRANEPEKRGRGRPKGSGPGRIEGRFAVKVTEEYKAWIGAFADKLGVTEADVFREAMRRYATAEAFRLPPIK
jgi:hypothetical protein